jgi:Na+-driven multidrug efflux pump
MYILNILIKMVDIVFWITLIALLTCLSTSLSYYISSKYPDNAYQKLNHTTRMMIILGLVIGTILLFKLRFYPIILLFKLIFALIKFIIFIIKQTLSNLRII